MKYKRGLKVRKENFLNLKLIALIFTGIFLGCNFSDFVNHKETPSQNKPKTTESPDSKLTKASKDFENECYSFDKTGLKIDGRNREARYKCESAFILDNQGYFPTLLVRAYNDEPFNLEEAVKSNAAAIEKEGKKVKQSPLKVGGANAIRLDITYTYPKNEKRFQDGKLVTEGKAYMIFVDTKGVLTDPAIRGTISSISLDGNLNQPEQAVIVEQVINSWKWK